MPAAWASVDRLEGEARRRPSPAGRAITGAPVRSPQTLQLLDRGGAERVAGGEHHRLPSSAKSCASLPMVVVLPVPLTPTIRMTNGFLRRIDDQRQRHRRQHLADLVGEQRRAPRPA